MFKKLGVPVLGIASLFTFSNASAEGNLGIALNYGVFSGATLEMSYPLTDTLQVRGAVSNGMGVSESSSDSDIDYDVTADGGINRLALDYHPFGNSFFVSAGYAVNNFALDADGRVSSAESVEIGDTQYTATSDVRLQGSLDWDSAPTLSFGWGHSPKQGLGFLVEIGAYFTGAPDVALSGTGTVNDGTQDYDVSSEIADDINREEKKLKDDVGDYDFLPMLQAGVTYRF